MIAFVVLNLLLTACATRLAEPAPVAAITSSVVDMKSAGLELAESAEKLPELQYNLFGQGKGWLAIDARIFLTSDNGKNWDEVSAQVPENYTLGRVQFLDENQAWAFYFGGEGTELKYRLYTTNDAGRTWNELSEAVKPILSSHEFIPDGKVYIQRLNPQIGYLLVKNSTGVNFSNGILLKTSDGGGKWVEVPSPAGEAFVFADETRAFMLKAPAYDSLYATSDSGQTWIELTDLPKTDGAEAYRVGLPEFHADGYGVYPVFAYKGETLLTTSIMQSNDYGKNWSLGVEDLTQSEQAPGSEPFFQLLPDGNLSRWSRIPSGGGAMAENGTQAAQKAQIVTLSAFGTSDAWGTFISGFCNAQLVVGQEQLHCSQDQLLGTTTDGGKTWQPLPLPIVVSKSSKSIFTRAAEAKEPPNIGDLNGPQLKAVNPTVKVAVGQGFDQCEIPGNAALDAWQNSSPYNVVNLYIGGSARACSNRALTYSKVSYMYNSGWTFIPTWVGPQASCTDYRSRMSADPATAYQQGVDNANQAMAKMNELGLTDANGQGGVVYYDLEYYVGDTACQNATRSFFEGWNARLHQLGALSGVYGASCHYWSTNNPPQNLSNLATLTNRLDAVWIAKYISTPYYYNSSVNVWGIASCFPD
ncbi:MAG TPA: glycoside hydrolase domain-containing protein, partial [Anaerolineaceae bacterium]|nr:glycoside hydrolase domain-containing protein [Anaerolineaceae bacterium]